MVINKKDALSDAPNSSNTNSITNTEKNNKHPINGLLDIVHVFFWNLPCQGY